MKEKKKNFLLLGIIAIVTILLVLYANMLFINNNKDAVSLTTKYLFEIKQNDFEDYITDNSDAIIYIARGKDVTLRNFEGKFVDLINDKELSKEIVYLNTDEINKNFFESLKQYYSESLKEENPIISAKANLLIIKDRKIESILYTETKTIQIEDVLEFLEKNDVIE